MNHPNIVHFISCIRSEHHLNIILEYVENGSLLAIIKKFGTFPETLTSVYTSQILEGLAYLHEQGVIHRYLLVYFPFDLIFFNKPLIKQGYKSSKYAYNQGRNDKSS